MFGEGTLVGDAVKGISDRIDEFKEDVNEDGGIVKHLLKSGISWFATGFKLFKQNILEPLWQWLYPKIVGIYTDIKEGTALSKAMEMNNSDRSTYSTDINKYDEKGKSVSKSVEVIRDTFTGGLGTPTYINDSGKAIDMDYRDTVVLNGATYLYERYKDGTVIVKCEYTKEYIRFNSTNGLPTNANKIIYGTLLTKDGRPPNGTIITGAIGGGIVGSILGGAAAATLAGTLAGIGGAIAAFATPVGWVVGIAAVIGAATLGAGLSAKVYNILGGGKSVEGEIDVNSNSSACVEILEAFGFDIGNGYSWPCENNSTGRVDFGWGEEKSGNAPSVTRKQNALSKGLLYDESANKFYKYKAGTAGSSKEYLSDEEVDRIIEGKGRKIRAREKQFIK